MTDRDIEHLAVLARIKLTTEEKKTCAAELGLILDSVQVLNDIPTDEVEPLIHVLPLYNVMRDDEVRPSLSNNEAMANAPLHEESKFKVPRLL